jgi:hypothetical protein
MHHYDEGDHRNRMTAQLCWPGNRDDNWYKVDMHVHTCAIKGLRRTPRGSGGGRPTAGPGPYLYYRS